MNTSSTTPVVSRTHVQKSRLANRRSILTGALLPVVLAGPAFAADLILGPDASINSDAGTQLYSDGLREGLIDANNDFTTPNPLNGPDSGQGAGVSLGLRMGQTQGWGENDTWVYTGEIFTGPNGILSFAAQNDDTDWFRIDNVVRLSDTVWNVANAFVVNNLPVNSWVQFEYRVANGGGGAGPSNQIDAATGQINWNATTGVVFSHTDEAGSLDAAVYDGGKPAEGAGGGQTLFRFQNGFGLTDDLNLQTSATLTVNGANTTINESSLRFTNTTPSTLTINDGGAHKVLGILGTTQWATLDSGGTPVTLDGTTDLRPLGAQTDNGNLVRVTRNGTGKLILDTGNANSNLGSTTFIAGTGTIEVLSANGTTPIPNAKLEIANAGVIRIGSTGAAPATFSNEITATAPGTGTILHNSPNYDTLSTLVRVNLGASLTFDVTGGRLYAGGGITAGVNSQLIKSGSGMLRSVGPLTVRGLTVNAGRFEVLGSTTLLSNPVLNGGVLALRNTSGTGTMPAGGVVISGAGILEGRAGSFGPGTTPLQITNNGTFRLGEDLPYNGVFLPSTSTGLYGFFYGGDDRGANANFNSYTNFSTYFDRRGGLESTALTSAGSTAALSFDPAGGDTSMFSMYGQTRTNNIVARMVGKIIIPQAGDYTFGTTSDDGSMLYIDGVPVVSNNFDQGMTRRAGTINLSAGAHDIDMGYYEGGGGNGFVVDWSGPGIAQQTLPNSVLVPAAHEVFPNPITIAGSGNIQVTALTGRLTGGVTFQAGGNFGSSGYDLTVDNITLPTSGGTYTFSPSNEVTLSHIVDNGNPVAIVKTGTGVLTIDNLGAPQLTNANSTIAVNGGALGILLGGAVNPTGLATISFNGGGVVLSSKNGDQTYTIPNFTGDAILQARKLASGVAGDPLVPIMINLQGNLNVPAGRKITLGTANDYIEVLGGSATGSGTVGIAGGTVNTTTNTAMQGLKVNFSAGSSILNMLTNAPTVGGISNDLTAAGNVVVGDGAIGTAVLTINGADSANYTGAINANLGTTVSVVKNGPGRQSLTGPSQATSYTLNSGILELSSAALNAAATPVNLTGGTLEFANSGLLLKVYDSNPRVAVGGVADGYSALMNTLPGVFTRFNAIGTPAITTSTAANGNLRISYNPGGGAEVPFAIHGHTGADNIEAIFTGLLEVPVGMAGSWTFDPRSDDGTMVYIDGVLVSNNNFPQGIGHVPRPGSINLTEGRHEIVMTFNEGEGGAGMYVNVTAPGGTPMILPNTLLYHRDINVPNPINVTGSAAINANKGTVVLGNLTQATAATLSITGGGSVSFPQTNLTGGAVFNVSVAPDTLLRPGNVAGTSTLNATGGGTVLLDYDGANGPQFATGTINANGATVAAAMKQGGLNPLGSATVNLSNGGILGLSTGLPSGEFTYSNPVVVGAGGGGIRAGRFSSGPAGIVLTQTYDQPISVTNNAPLSLSSADGYTLSLTGTIGSNGPISVTGGNVTTTATVAGSSLAVTGGRLDSYAPLTFTTGGTIASGATLRLNGNAYAGGTLNVRGTLEFNAAHTGNVPSTYDGGTLKVSTGIVDYAGPVAGTVPAETTVASTLTAKSFTFTNPAGGFDSDQGLAFTLAATPLFNKPLGNADVNFGPQGVADPVFNAFFGGPTGDAFTATLTGSFTSPVTGPITFGTSIVDDNGSVWVDVNQNGVFERNGSGGDERITFAGCCGPALNDTVNGVVNLVSGQKYDMVFALQDTGGGSSYAAKWDIGNIAGPGGLTKFVNAGDPTQAGIWSTTTAKTGGAKLDVATGAELRVGAVTNITDAFLNGTDAKLTINGSAGSNSSIQTLRNSFGTNIVDVAAGNTVTVSHLTVAPAATLTKTGPGTITTSGLSIGGGGFLTIEAGTVINTTPAVSGVANYASGGVNVTGTGTFQLQGALSGSVTVSTTGTLRGAGSMGLLTVEGTGVVAPGVGATPGVINVNGGVNMAGGTALQLEMFTSALSDKLNVAGTVFLAQSPGPVLSISGGAGFTWQPFEVFPLVLNDLDDLVTGTFEGLGEGSVLMVNGIPFNISYSMNLDGGAVANDIGITAIPEPGSAVLLVGGFALLIGAQRKRSNLRS